MMIMPAISPRNTAEHIDIMECFTKPECRRNTRPPSHCFHLVFRCFENVPPKGGRAARYTRTAAPLGAGRR